MESKKFDKLVEETKALVMINSDQNCIKYLDIKQNDMDTDKNNSKQRKGISSERMCYDTFVLLGKQHLF